MRFNMIGSDSKSKAKTAALMRRRGFILEMAYFAAVMAGLVPVMTLIGWRKPWL
jgi:hypothetical protein